MHVRTLTGAYEVCILFTMWIVLFSTVYLFCFSFPFPFGARIRKGDTPNVANAEYYDSMKPWKSLQNIHTTGGLNSFNVCVYIRNIFVHTYTYVWPLFFFVLSNTLRCLVQAVFLFLCRYLFSSAVCVCVCAQAKLCVHVSCSLILLNVQDSDLGRLRGNEEEQKHTHTYMHTHHILVSNWKLNGLHFLVVIYSGLIFIFRSFFLKIFQLLCKM